MRIVIGTWGTSAAVRIPAPVMLAANLRPGQDVEIRADAGTIVIAPVGRAPYDLASLLDGITGDNLHEEILTAGAVGWEIW